MPLYEYECSACGARFELIQKFSDAPATACAKCGQGPVHKLLSAPAIQFKGSGWYITDYARKGESAATTSSPAAPGSTASSGGSDAAPSTSPSTPASSSDSKPATKTE